MPLYGAGDIGGTPAVVPVTTPNGKQAKVAAMVVVDAQGGVPEPRMLASNATLAAGATTTGVTGVAGSGYIWSTVMNGTSPQLVLEWLGPDGATWLTLDTVTASGSKGIGASPNASLRLRNAGANAITGLYSRID